VKITVGILIDGRSNSASAGVPLQAWGGLIEVYFTRVSAGPHRQQAVETGDRARRQAQPRAPLLGRRNVLLEQLGIAIGTRGDDHEIDALLQHGLAEIAHRVLAGRLDHDVRLGLEQRL
jgi:hypothetical protein